MQVFLVILKKSKKKKKIQTGNKTYEVKINKSHTAIWPTLDLAYQTYLELQRKSYFPQQLITGKKI